MALYGIPYQGSKGKFAPMILRAIEQRLPEGAPRVLLDPFCGGYAVSHCFHEAGWQTIASDLDRYTVALLAQVLGDGLPESAASAWVTRDEFKQCRDDPDATGKPDWWIGFVRQAWSFGNSGTSYAYGAHYEVTKRLIHELVVDGRTDAELGVMTLVGLPEQARIAALTSVRQRRLAWLRISAAAGVSVSEQRLQTVERAEQMMMVRGSAPTVRDYRDALSDAPAGAVIYLDPPYRDTATYTIGGFNSDEMWRQATLAAQAGRQV